MRVFFFFSHGNSNQAKITLLHINWKTKLGLAKALYAKLVFSISEDSKNSGKTQNVNTEKTLRNILAESLKSIYELIPF